MEKFWSKTRKRKTGCIEWTGYITKFGYGRLCKDMKYYQAHRFAWIITNGKIPKGLCVLHKCDNRKCVNPEHLFLGTYMDNRIDMVNKGREYHRKGEEHPKSKLTEDDVLEIRKIGQSMFQKELAEKYGVQKRTIGYVLSGKIWKELAIKHNYTPPEKIIGKRKK